MATKIVKLSEEQLASIGATAENFADKFTAHVAATKQLEKVMAESPDNKSLEAKITALETKITALETAGKVDVGAAVKTFIEGADGKKLVEGIAEAKASATVIAAHAATGTLPAKDAPATAGGSSVGAAELIKAGKFEEAYAADEKIQAEFTDAKSYAAYMKATVAGKVRIVQNAR